ncbi:Os04g0252000 [Oryza sativa Japonica Group]|uniref:Os04g0252000 protein n=1 Tax=Oryza sativa subsp. japonica TaxID=39947 RepID=Q0JEK7_ORYSJ|nr:Os04g0252000 [Oryza sativa Japonica Group]|eukprot:NP_001052316.2 Os04g0252000 [Oryza sativa Japonica Group]
MCCCNIDYVLLQNFRYGLDKESAENLDISTRGSFAHKTTAEGRELLDLILVNDFFGRSEAVPEVKIIHEESLHVESEEEEIHSLEIPFQFEEDLFEDYGNTSNYSCEKRPPTKVNSNDPLDKAMLKETVKKLTIIMSNEWLREGELSSESIQIRCPASTITCLIGEPLPVPEPIEIVMVVSPFEAPESIFEESIKEFNEGEDESGETIDLPKTDQPSRAPIDLKPLPSSLSYAFLNGDVESPVIISDKLSERETARLIAVLEKHRAAFGYSLQDLKGISPTLCTHHIPLEPSCTPSREPQRRLNNVMKEVVKKEVLKLLHVGIIYPMPYSEWVSPVQVVPKKGGMTVVENSNNDDFAMGAVLGQTKDRKHQAIAYASKTLTGAQLNYATTEKELLAVVFAIDKFKSYLVGAKHATIVNFMVAGHVPMGENKKRLIYESRRHLWDAPYLYRVCSDGLLRRCVPVDEGMKIIEKCHPAPYGGHYGAFRTHAKI